eukprot:745999-Hanusia_phi.AAC.10
MQTTASGEAELSRGVGKLTWPLSVGEAVLAFRSNGCRTLAKVVDRVRRIADLRAGGASQHDSSRPPSRSSIAEGASSSSHFYLVLSTLCSPSRCLVADALHYQTVAVEKVGKLHETLQAFIQIIFARRQDKSKQQGDSNSKDVLPQQLSDALRKKKNVAIDDFELDGEFRAECARQLTPHAVDDQLIVKLKEIELKERQL